MRTESNLGRSLHVIVLALCGLSFYALLVTLLVLIVGLVVSPHASAQAPPGNAAWAPTGSLNTARFDHSATRLQNGKVLVVGGTAGSQKSLDSAELYDPTSATWSGTGHLAIARTHHSATLLPSGKVLVVLGGGESDQSAEVYDPATGAWSATAGLLALHGRGHTATLLRNGQVLVAGGTAEGNNVPGRTELYDPVNGTWIFSGSLHQGRSEHTATLLRNGQVLVAGGLDSGGSDLDSAELYDPATGAWSVTGSLNRRRHSHSAQLLQDGSVLIVDGEAYGGCPCGAPSELYDPATGKWSTTHNSKDLYNSVDHPSTLLASGEVLVEGGGDGIDGNVVQADLYDPRTGLWSATAALSTARGGHTATLLTNGQVLVAGGADYSVLRSAELYAPPIAVDASFSGSWFDPTQSGHGLMLEVLPDNRLLALWFAFNPAGNQQAWFGGVGTYSGNSATITDVVLPSGGRWIPNFDQNAIALNQWGTLTFTFNDHDHGRVNFNSVLGYGVGGMNLSRLTQPAAQTPLTVPIGSPGALTTDANGNLYFSSSPNLIFKLDAQGKLARIAGTGAAGYSGDGGPATQAQLNFPLSYPELVKDPVDYSELVGGLAVDRNENVYIADAYNNRVRKIDANGIITTAVGNGAGANSGDGGTAVNASIHWPQGVATDVAGNLYISTVFSSLRKVTANGIITQLAGSNCGSGYLGPGLCAPEEIAVDAASNIFVPDAYCRVRKVKPDGSSVTVAGDDTHPDGHGSAFTCGYSGDGGPALNAALQPPYSVAVDTTGNLFIADTYNHCIRKVATTQVITTVAGVCQAAGYSGDGGAATSARLDHPRGVAVADGNVYIADTNNHRVRKISADGIITTIAGNGAELGASTAGAIGPAFTGNWFDPTQSGHGLMLEVLPDNRLLALWFAFNPAGSEQSWFGGVGTYSGNTATITDVAQPTGGRWIPNFDPHAITLNPWGTLTFTFTDCNDGKVNFSSVRGYGSGSMNLTRLTLPAGLTCP